MAARSVSLISFWCCALVMCYASFFFYPRWQQPYTEASISWDVSGYYWYLPSIFIYHDLKHQSFKDSILHKYQPTRTEFMQAMQVDNGNYVMKYASGMAVMYLPFFGAAHLAAGALGYPRDGFSPPYQLAIQVGGLLVSLIGLWFFRRLLLFYYTEGVVAITLLLLVLGSNYLNYSAIDAGMSHCWLFTVYVLLLLSTHYFYTTFRLKYALFIGLLVGLATLTRPTDILSATIPLLWGMNGLSVTSIRRQAAVLWKNYRALLLAALCGAAVIMIQLVYWKYVSGHWLVYSYPGQKLYFRSPNFSNYTFSYRSGWLVYAPLLALAFAGILPYIKFGEHKVAIIAFFLLNYYVVCSWNIWWYGGRAMIQSYPVLFFCVAELVNIFRFRKVLWWLGLPVMGLCIYYNTWITYVYHKDGLWDVDCMSKAYFWHILGRWSPPGDLVVLKDNPDLFTGIPADEHLLYENNFETETGPLFRTDSAKKARYLLLEKDNQNSPDFKFACRVRGEGWLRADALFTCGDKEYEGWKMAQFIVRLHRHGAVEKESMIRVYRLLEPHQARRIAMDVRIPAEKPDSVTVLIWNGGSNVPLRVEDIRVVGFK